MNFLNDIKLTNIFLIALLVLLIIDIGMTIHLHAMEEQNERSINSVNRYLTETTKPILDYRIEEDRRVK